MNLHKSYWLERWKAMMCKKRNMRKTMCCNILECSRCCYRADMKIIAFDFLASVWREEKQHEGID
jgi:hypothetical protein